MRRPPTDAGVGHWSPGTPPRKRVARGAVMRAVRDAHGAARPAPPPGLAAAHSARPPRVTDARCRPSHHWFVFGWRQCARRRTRARRRRREAAGAAAPVGGARATSPAGVADVTDRVRHRWHHIRRMVRAAAAWCGVRPALFLLLRRDARRRSRAARSRPLRRVQRLRRSRAVYFSRLIHAQSSSCT